MRLFIAVKIIFAVLVAAKADSRPAREGEINRASVVWGSLVSRQAAAALQTGEPA